MPITPTASPTPLLAPKPAETHVLYFRDSGRIEPSEISGRPGELVQLILVGGQRKHDLTSSALNISEDVPPGQVEVITVQLPARTGRYEFWSGQPGDREAGMTGAVEVS